LTINDDSASTESASSTSASDQSYLDTSSASSEAASSKSTTEEESAESASASSQDKSIIHENTQEEAEQEASDTSVIVTNTSDISIDNSYTVEKDESTKQNVKNKLIVSGASQSTIQAVSNLNAVGSAVAVQTNVANASAVSGNIVQSNISNVVNGL
jgi:hypothetical protein